MKALHAMLAVLMLVPTLAAHAGDVCADDPITSIPVGTKLRLVSDKIVVAYGEVVGHLSRTGCVLGMTSADSHDNRRLVPREFEITRIIQESPADGAHILLKDPKGTVGKLYCNGGTANTVSQLTRNIAPDLVLGGKVLSLEQCHRTVDALRPKSKAESLNAVAEGGDVKGVPAGGEAATSTEQPKPEGLRAI